MKRCVDWIKESHPYRCIISNNHTYASMDLAEAEYAFYTWNLNEIPMAAKNAIYKGLEYELYDSVCSAYFLLMRYHYAKGHYQDLIKSHQQLRHYAGLASPSAGFFSMPDLADSWLSLKLENVREVHDWIKDDAINRKTVIPRGVGRDRIGRAHYLLLNQEYDELLPFVEDTIQVFQKRGLNLLLIYILLIKASGLYHIKEPEQAVRTMELVMSGAFETESSAPLWNSRPSYGR